MLFAIPRTTVHRPGLAIALPELEVLTLATRQSRSANTRPTAVRFLLAHSAKSKHADIRFRTGTYRQTPCAYRAMLTRRTYTRDSNVPSKCRWKGDPPKGSRR